MLRATIATYRPPVGAIDYIICGIGALLLARSVISGRVLVNPPLETLCFELAASS